MRYKTSEMMVDAFVGYLNDGKINLIPPFQRYHVWTPHDRRKLITNIVEGRPIPAIFFYRDKDETGEKYVYNILDGKQRLETLIMFISDKHSSLKINEPSHYFGERKYKEQIGFKVRVGGGQKQGMEDLNADAIRELREYIIPTIEITLDQDNPSALDEIINLFVDINSTGKAVKRFSIVNAMSKDKLFRSVFRLIARKESRGKDTIYYPRRNEFTAVLETLQTVSGMRDRNSKVDRMWELTVEFVLFLRTKTHKNPADILKNFIRAASSGSANSPLTEAENSSLRDVFAFIRKLYISDAKFRASRFATNQIHFYTMLTTIIGDDLLSDNREALSQKLRKLASIVEGQTRAPRALGKKIETYQELSEKQSTHVGRRQSRQTIFREIIDAL